MCGNSQPAEGLEEVLYLTELLLKSEGKLNSNGVFGHTFVERWRKRKRESMFFFLTFWGSIDTPRTNIYVEKVHFA